MQRSVLWLLIVPVPLHFLRPEAGRPAARCVGQDRLSRASDRSNLRLSDASGNYVR